MPTDNKPEIDPFLAGIEAKIAALQQLRESYIAALSVGALGFSSVDVTALTPGITVGLTGVSGTTAIGSLTPGTGPIDLPTGVFRDKGLADAIRAYLSMAKRKQTFKDIKTALMEGGLATTAEFFDQTLNGTLHRMRKSGELLQFKDGWDLAASYPESFRQRLAEGKEAATPKRKRAVKRPARKERSVAPKAEKKPDAPEPMAPTLRAV